jgi:hypothetical protein
VFAKPQARFYLNPLLPSLAAFRLPSIQPFSFHALAHSFPQRATPISPAFNDFRTLHSRCCSTGSINSFRIKRFRTLFRRNRGISPLAPSSSLSLSSCTSSISFASFLFRTLPFSVSRNSFICHSYENTRGVYQLFPFWNSPLDATDSTRSKRPPPLCREPRITNHQPRILLTAGRWTWQAGRERRASSAAGVQRELGRGRRRFRR